MICRICVSRPAKYLERVNLIPQGHSKIDFKLWLNYKQAILRRLLNLDPKLLYLAEGISMFEAKLRNLLKKGWLYLNIRVCSLHTCFLFIISCGSLCSIYIKDLPSYTFFTQILVKSWYFFLMLWMTTFSLLINGFSHLMHLSICLHFTVHAVCFLHDSVVVQTDF